jgi:hypothetical protein
MATFESYKEIIVELQRLSAGIESGKLNEEDLRRFVDLSQQLYERSIILNYKALEAKVFGEKSTAAIVPEATPVETPKVEIKPRTETPKEEPSILFDFSTDQIEEEEEIEAIQHTPETIEVAMDEEVNPKTETIIEQQVTTISNDQVQSFYQRFTKVHNDSLNDQLSNAKIESLKSAFGLNDRMRIIAELFNGDSEAFSEMISDLDQLNSGEIARKKLSEIAVSRHWDAEDKLVEEFVKTVDRKFD